MSTSELIQRIESKASWLRQDAKMLAESISALKIKRDFPTLAEDAMDLAERELVEALRLVRRSRASYNAKPAECDPYIVGERASA